MDASSWTVRWHFFATLLLFVSLTAIRLLFRLRSKQLSFAGALRAESALTVAIRWALGTVLLFAVVLYAFPWFSGFEQIRSLLVARLPQVVRAAGVLLGTAGLALLVWVHRLLGPRFSTTVTVSPAAQLITTGPYGSVRHPMYVAYLLFFTGVFLVSGAWLLAGTGMAIILTLMTVRLPQEEQHLAERFGDAWAAYAETTPRFVPGLRPPVGGPAVARPVTRNADPAAAGSDGVE